jgi:Na+/proline symporter
MFVYVAGALIVFATLLARMPGGWSEVITAGAAAGKFTVLDLSTDPRAIYTLWAGIVGGVAITLATHGTDQYLVQRLLSGRSARQASAGLVLSGVIVFVQFVLFLMIGVMLFAYYQHVPVPELGRNDEILPRFIVSSLTGGVAGFIIAAIVAAALSPSLNAMAATTVNDFYKRYLNPGADEPTLMRLSRRATIAWGVVQLLVALGAQWMERSVLDAGLAVLSLTAGPVLGAFLMGVLTRRVSEGPMLAGLVIGMAAVVWAWWTGAVAWTWYAFLGAAVTCGCAAIISAMTPRADG